MGRHRRIKSFHGGVKMKHYTEEIIVFNGIKYRPVTDVLHEEDGLLTNEVQCQDGKRYKAYYSLDHYNNNAWDKPLFIK